MSHYHTCTTVSLLRCPITNGRLSLYLDFYPAIRNPEMMKMKSDFLAYYKKKCRGQDQKWDIVYKHFFNFVQGHCTYGKVTVDLCKKFREYLLGANQLRLTHLKISKNSAAGYYSTFRGFLTSPIEKR